VRTYDVGVTDTVGAEGVFRCQADNLEHAREQALSEETVTGVTYVRVTTTVQVDLGEVIDRDLEGFLDLIAERSGDPLLMDIGYAVDRAEGDSLVIRVWGECCEEAIS
jgi:hypothetical protein